MVPDSRECNPCAKLTDEKPLRGCNLNYRNMLRISDSRHCKSHPSRHLPASKALLPTNKAGWSELLWRRICKTDFKTSREFQRLHFGSEFCITPARSPEWADLWKMSTPWCWFSIRKCGPPHLKPVAKNVSGAHAPLYSVRMIEMTTTAVVVDRSPVSSDFDINLTGEST